MPAGAEHVAHVLVTGVDRESPLLVESDRLACAKVICTWAALGDGTSGMRFSAVAFGVTRTPVLSS